MKKIKQFVVCLGLVLVCNAGAEPPRNIILCIGDGMGPEQVKAARCYSGSNLVFEDFPFRGEMTTASADSPITDSAASATAMATGRKVNNGVISAGDSCIIPMLETALELFQVRGKASGLVTTTHLTHATPAAFGAHEPRRGNYLQIAGDYLLQTRPNVLFGGGGKGMNERCARVLRYAVVTNRDGLLDRDLLVCPHICGLFGQGHMPYETDGLGELPRLPEMTSTALNILENDPDGFFLMVEGGRIDHAGHKNDLVRNIGETLAFSEAVEVIVNWAAGREDTLVIVTADHETGGLQVVRDMGPGVYPEVTWASKGHTATPVSVYGWGASANCVTNIHDNTDVYTAMVSSVNGAEAEPGAKDPETEPSTEDSEIVLSTEDSELVLPEEAQK